MEKESEKGKERMKERCKKGRTGETQNWRGKKK